jgi:hypothetical protein
MFKEFILNDDLFLKSFRNLELEVLYFEIFQKARAIIKNLNKINNFFIIIINS